MDNIEGWGWWMEDHETRLAHTRVLGVLVSTDFVGIEYQYHDSQKGKPWRTTLFDLAEELLGLSLERAPAPEKPLPT
ncbi:MAG: hypothetical protein ABIP48_06465 [Planctomycetota bacterium]